MLAEGIFKAQIWLDHTTFYENLIRTTMMSQGLVWSDNEHA